MRANAQILASAALAVALPAGSPPAAAADFTGYVQSAVVAPQSDGRGGEAAWFSEIRFAAEGDAGPLRLGAAYEFGLRRAAPVAETGTDWLDLQGDLSNGGRLESRHRVDRLQLSWSSADGMDAIIGRQAISWGTTAYLTPADPFVPFSPSDTFRDYRRGIDALRLRAYPDALSEVELVLRPSRLQDREEMTALARALTTWGNWEVSAWAGSLYGDAAIALGAAGETAGSALRFETSFRDTGRQIRIRGTLGTYPTFEIAERSLSLALEYQHDGLGAARREDFEGLLQSGPYRRGELQLPGRDQVLARAAYQIHPLWEVATLVLWNLNTGSAVLAPGFSYSVSDEATLTGSAVANIRDWIPEDALPADARDRTESIAVQLSLTWYF